MTSAQTRAYERTKHKRRAYLANIEGEAGSRGEGQVEGLDTEKVVERLPHALHDEARWVRLVAEAEGDHLDDLGVAHGEVDL